MKRTLSAHGGAAIYLIAILVNLGIQLLGSIVLAVVMLLSGNGGVPGFVNYILMAVLQLGFLLSFRLYTKKTNRGIAFPVRVPKWYDMLLCVLAAALSVLCFIFPAQWFALWLEKIGYAFSTDIPLGSALDVTLCVLVTVIIAPVCEELVFRGALLTGLTKKLGVLPSVLLSGLAFSLMHMNPEQTVYQFFMGCACAYLAICSGTVVCPMIVHACNNLIALILEFTGTAFLDVFFAGQLAFALSTVGFLALGITVRSGSFRRKFDKKQRFAARARQKKRVFGGNGADTSPSRARQRGLRAGARKVAASRAQIVCDLSRHRAVRLPYHLDYGFRGQYFGAYVSNRPISRIID